MTTLNFSEPVVFLWEDTAKSVTTVLEAATCLMTGWPAITGKSFADALTISLAALEGREVGVEVVSEAFVLAVVEAGYSIYT